MFEGLTKLAANVQNKDFLNDLKKGTLHRALGIPQDQEIPVSLLQSLKNKAPGQKANVGGKTISITPKLEKKVNFALNARKWKK